MAPLYLASLSKTRQRILKNAGFSFRGCAPLCDEASLKQEIIPLKLSPEETAQRLALEKAKSISLLYKDVLCLGCDQVSALNGQPLHKPKNFDDAWEQLTCVSGKKVSYSTALSLCLAGQEVWAYVETCCVTYRHLSTAQKRWYLDQRTQKSLAQEGLLLIEGIGIQLVESIEGDQMGLLGLPLCPLISELFRRQALEY